MYPTELGSSARRVRLWHEVTSLVTLWLFRYRRMCREFRRLWSS